MLFTTFMDDVTKERRKKARALRVGYRRLKELLIAEYAFTDEVSFLSKAKKICRISYMKGIRSLRRER